jgi:hypothetical protein
VDDAILTILGRQSSVVRRWEWRWRDAELPELKSFRLGGVPPPGGASVPSRGQSPSIHSPLQQLPPFINTRELRFELRQPRISLSDRRAITLVKRGVGHRLM